MFDTAILVVHVVSGTAAMVLGPLAMRQDVRRFSSGRRATGPFSAAYRTVVLVVCLTATALVIVARADLWWLIPVSGLTYGLALLAASAAERRFRGWTHGYVHGQGGSYIALVTALIVVSLTVDGPVTGPAQLIPWLAPTAVGTVLIELWRRRLVVGLAAGTTADDDLDRRRKLSVAGRATSENVTHRAAAGAATGSSGVSR